jgi:hypothetical protein
VPKSWKASPTNKKHLLGERRRRPSIGNGAAVFFALPSATQDSGLVTSLFDLEVSLAWRSRHAHHRDRQVFAGVDVGHALLAKRSLTPLSRNTPQVIDW